MQRLVQWIIGGALVASVAVGPAAMAVAPQTGNLFSEACKNNSTSEICSTGQSENIGTFVTRIVNILLWAVGILGVVMLIIGGFKYITASGDANKLTSAKNTIIYAMIGIAVAALSYAIVIWVNSFATK